METAAHSTATMTRVLVTLTGTGGDALDSVVVGHQVMIILLLLLEAVDVVEHQHSVVLEEGVVWSST